MAETNKGRMSFMGWVFCGSTLAFYVGMRWGMLAETYRDIVKGLSRSLSEDLFLAILHDPFAVSFESVPLICGLSLFCCVWGLYAYVVGADSDVRHGDEYGSAHKGSVRDGTQYKDAKNPDNNIVLTKHLGIAIRNNGNVQKKVTSRNILVLGSTGSNKTTGFVMPNLLQLRADRDVVVVDPKGTTLASCGHALVSAGISINVFNTVDISMSDLYNPLANIQTTADITDFVTCLITNTNDGKKSQDPIWDNGEALFFRAILTLLIEWYPKEEHTFANLVRLTDLADVAQGGNKQQKSPLDLIFDQIATGMRTTVDEADVQGESEGGFDAGGYEVSGPGIQVPSSMRRRDGVVPAQVVKPGGRRGLDPDEDEALKIWSEFKHAPDRTRQSFIVSAHARLAYLSTPEVLRLLSGDDGRDEIHLERLGQVRDEAGNALRPRVIFVVSSDFNSSLNALLSIIMWQAIYLPMRMADTKCAGKLPRPVSLIFDEFRNIGKLSSFIQTVAVVRSRNIDVSIMLQTASQLEEIYGKEGAATIRGNCPTTLFLGGGHDVATAKIISEEIGKGTVYKEDWSHQGSGMNASASRQQSSIARDVLDPNEVATLSAGKALVMIGQEQVIEDDKSLVWEHRNYDATYMGERPKRRFDYKAWKEAGRPMGKNLLRWEEVWFEEELPLREKLKSIEQARRAAERELERASADERQRMGKGDLAVLKARLDFCTLKVTATEAKLACVHAKALVAAGQAGRADPALEAAATELEDEFTSVEREVKRRFSRSAANFICA